MGLSNFTTCYMLQLSWGGISSFFFPLIALNELLHTQRARIYKGINVPRSEIPHSNLCLFHFQSLFTFCHSTHFQPLVFGEKKRVELFILILTEASNGVEKTSNYFSTIIIFTLSIFQHTMHVCVVLLHVVQSKRNQPHEVVHICVTCITTIVVNTLVYIVRIDI